MSADELTLRDRLGRVQRLAALVGAVGVALCLLGAVCSTRQFFFSYLFGYLFWVGVALGGFGILMIHHLTGGGWGFAIRRFLEAGLMTLPLLAGLFVPLLFGLPHLYRWARPHGGGEERPPLPHQHLYLSVPAFTGRAVVIFGLWIGLAVLLNRFSHQQDATADDPAPTRRLRTLAGPGLVLYGLTGTFALVDWVMVLESNWYSSVFPVQVMIGQMLSTLALAIALLAWLRNRPPLRDRLRDEHFHSLGSLLLALVMLWTYLAISQLLIIWSGNLPREIFWYLHRSAGGWKWWIGFLTLFHFFIPFCLLLSKGVKRRVPILGGIALGVFIIHAANDFWLVAPALHPEGLWISWLDLAAPLGLGGVWLAVFLARLKSRPLLPAHDPRMDGDLAHGH